MRYLSVCSGIEAATQGWHRLGWTPAGFSEIEPFPRAVLQERYGAVAVDWDHRHSPQSNVLPLFGDFTQIEEHHVGPIDLLVGGTPCFPKGTMIASTRGLIPIEAIQVGDEVLTHEHRFRRVLRTGSKMAETVEVTGQGHYGFVTTANHPFLARQKMGQSTRVNGRAVRKTWITDADWVAAGHMEGKHWACVSRWPEMAMPPITVIGNETVPSLPARDLMMIAGAYLGDGWIRSNERRGAVMFGLNPRKLDALRPAFDAYGKWHSSQEQTTVRATICSRPLARWLAENFGTGAANKRVPMWALGHPEREALLQGYLLTDGGKVQFGHRATTISPDLALTMRMLAVSCGYSSSVGFSERPATHKIEGRTVNQSDTYTVTFGTSARSSFEDGGFRWQRVRSVQPTGRVERVYDLEVEEDHSYVADGICVHNCQSFSVAGKRLGLDDPRGHLTLEFLALARRLQPRWIVWENVPGVLSDDGGRTFGTFLGLLGECGFRWAYRVLDAQFVRVAGIERAVPQRRRRVFVVGCAGNGPRPEAVLFERESLSGHPAPRREAGQGTSADVAPSLVSSGRGVERCGETRGQDPVIAVADVAPTLNAAFGSKLGLEDQHIRGGGACSLPPVSMCLNAGGMGRQDYETETLIPTTGAVFDDALAIQAGALRENPNSGPDGVGVQEGIAYTLEARAEVQAVAHALRAEGFDASEDGSGRGTPLVPVAYQTSGNCGAWETGSITGALDTGTDPNSHVICFSAKDYGADAAEIAPTLRSMGHDTSHPNGGGQVAVAFAQNQRGEVRTSEISPQLTCGGGKPGEGYPAVAFDMRGRDGGAMPEGPHETANIRAASDGSSRSYVAQTWAVRRLTPRECERLQGFPDDFTAITYRGKPAADGPRYKALGNSMAVNVMRWIGERIAYVEAAALGEKQ